MSCFEMTQKFVEEVRQQKTEEYSSDLAWIATVGVLTARISHLLGHLKIFHPEAFEAVKKDFITYT